jgi:hypothetical protein
MAAKRKAAPKPEVTFTRASDTLETFLEGPARKAFLDELSRPKDLGGALGELRDAMRANVFSDGKSPVSLARIVRKLDERTRLEGFHVLHDWDGKADKLNDDTIPVDVVTYAIELSGSEPNEPGVLSILLDYHFVYLLALHVNGDRVERVSILVEVLDERDDASLEVEFFVLSLALIVEGDGDSTVEEGELTESLRQSVVAEVHCVENRRVGSKRDLGPGLVGGADFLERRADSSPVVGLAVDFAVPTDLQLEPLR